MKILISPNPSRDTDLKLTAVAARILSDAGAEVLLPEYARPICAEKGFEKIIYYDGEIGAHAPEAVIAVGGDGTFLKTAREAARCDSPIIGVNLGNIGFLTGLDPCDISMLKNLLTGEYRIEERMMLDVVISRGGEDIFRESALNDAIISRGATMRNIPLSLYSDGNEIKTFYGDGVVIATPTGSTAYSMSAGGPIVDPEAECIIVTPVCPHAFYAKSFVLEKNRRVSIRIGSLEQREARLSLDGMDSVTLETLDDITVTRSCRMIKIIKLKNGGFFERLKNKLTEQ